MKKHLRSAVLKRMAIILLVLLVSFSGWFLWQRKSTHVIPIAKNHTGWKNFYSPTMKVSFDYPSEYHISDWSKIPSSDNSIGVSVGPLHNVKDRDYAGPRNWFDLAIVVQPPDYPSVSKDTVNPPDPEFKALPKDTKVLQSLRLDGHDYKLVGYSNGDNMTVISLEACDSNNKCTHLIKRLDGTYIIIQIATSGYTDAPALKHDATNADYVNLVNVLSTLHF